MHPYAARNTRFLRQLRQAASESVCVWDLEVIAFERDAYITTVLARPPAPTEAYLDRVLDKPAVLAG
jgi:hypothetical protein